jgi:hypothetical protein
LFRLLRKEQSQQDVTKRRCAQTRSLIEGDAPDTMVGAFFSEAGSDSSAFFLDDRSLVCYRFGGAHVADELLDCEYDILSVDADPHTRTTNSDIRELILDGQRGRRPNYWGRLGDSGPGASPAACQGPSRALSKAQTRRSL